MRDFMNAQAHKLSGGETQRVAIARALSCSPKVILFDEPFANVDFENQVAIEHIIIQVNNQKNISVIFTSHNPIQAAKLSHEVASLFEGRLAPFTFENIYGGNIISDKKHPKACLIHNRIKIFLETNKTGPVRLSINPFKIQISRVQSIPSKENVFSGRLIQLADENDYVRAVVDIGIPLNLLLNRDQLSECPLTIGEQVNVLCPKEAIQTF
jgi:tungstate transport system ATP-binding protein